MVTETGIIVGCVSVQNLKFIKLSIYLNIWQGLKDNKIKNKSELTKIKSVNDNITHFRNDWKNRIIRMTMNDFQKTKNWL